MLRAKPSAAVAREPGYRPRSARTRSSAAPGLPPSACPCPAPAPPRRAIKPSSTIPTLRRADGMRQVVGTSATTSTTPAPLCVCRVILTMTYALDGGLQPAIARISAGQSGSAVCLRRFARRPTRAVRQGRGTARRLAPSTRRLVPEGKFGADNGGGPARLTLVGSHTGAKAQAAFSERVAAPDTAYPMLDQPSPSGVGREASSRVLRQRGEKE